MEQFRNLPTEQPKALSDLIGVRPGQVVSMSLTRGTRGQMTLFAFADGEGVSEECYPGDTFYQVLEGEMPLRLPDRTLILGAGQCLCVPAGTLHAIGGAGSFKLLQITL